MKRNIRLIIGIVIHTGLFLAACGSAPQPVDETEPAEVEPIAGKSYNQITLTERAAERLDVQTSPVREEQVNGAQHIVIPYSALIYDLNGETWVFISPAPLTYHRVAIIVDYIIDDLIVLVEGPPIGTEVAIVGVPELYGIDTGVGK
jgi:hypothetical protein